MYGTRKWLEMYDDNYKNDKIKYNHLEVQILLFDSL